jgi:hypothetical protein
MATQLKALGERADNQRRQSESPDAAGGDQEERDDRAARELAEVSDRLQAGADALRESV